jgi:diacylglycerol O-acyltransferase / wax synthase
VGRVVRAPEALRVSESLSALDATFLELEDGDRSAHMHIGGILVFDGPAPELDELRAHLLLRLDGLPRYRQRLSSRTARGLRRPGWEDDDDFDIVTHVTRAALPAPGGEAELLEWAGDFYSHRLDRARPLWRSVLLEGLEDGRWALATKTHHCLVDGVGARDAATVMLDPSPEPPPWRAPEASPPGAAHGLLRTGLDLAVHPGQVLDGALGLADLAIRDELSGAPPTSLNVPLGEHRRLAVAHLDLDRVKAIRAALGGTVNDVVLTLVTAGLRRLLLARGEPLPAEGLRAMVPVSLRPAGGGAELGNRVSTVFVALPVDEPDPAERFRRVHTEAARRKGGHQAAGGRALLELSALAPPALHALVARPGLATRLFNVTVTNVPGPPSTLYALGRELRTIIPLVPLAAAHAVGIAVVSYAGDLCVSVNADRDLVRDVDELIAGVQAELDALEALAAVS